MFSDRLAAGIALRVKQRKAWKVTRIEHLAALRAIAEALALVNRLHTTSFIQLQSSF